jgi:hypothetical protein
MKKMLSGFMLVLMFLFSSIVFGAGSGTTVTGDSVYHNSRTGSSFRVITVIFTADDSDGSIPDTTLNGNTTGITQGLLDGWQLSEAFIDCISGVTPTEDSDLYVYQRGVDLLDGNGVDEIDNTAKSAVYAAIDGSGPYPRPITGDIHITAEQASSATTAATGIFKFTFK